MLMRIFFHSGAGGIGRLSDSFSKNDVHKFLYKYSHRMSTQKGSNIHIENAFNVFREGNNDDRKKSGESGVAYSIIPITFTLSHFIRLLLLLVNVHIQHSQNDEIPTEVLFFLENIKKRVNGFLSIPHLMQRYRDCTK